jgi:hypothetical protein
MVHPERRCCSVFLSCLILFNTEDKSAKNYVEFIVILKIKRLKIDLYCDKFITLYKDRLFLEFFQKYRSCQTPT